MEIKALNDIIIVHEEEDKNVEALREEEKKNTLIIMPGEEDTLMVRKVFAVGDAVKGVNVGDYICFEKFIKFKIPYKGKKYLGLPEKAVIYALVEHEDELENVGVEPIPGAYNEADTYLS